MNAVTAHLEAVFDSYPQTPAILDAKAELHTMMQDAYDGLVATGMTPNDASAKVIFEFGDLDELAPTLGVVSDHPRSRDLGGIEAPSPPILRSLSSKRAASPIRPAARGFIWVWRWECSSPRLYPWYSSSPPLTRV